MEKDIIDIESPIEEETSSEKQYHHKGGVKNIDIVKEMKNSFLSYAMSVIVSRAIPDVRDGLKPVQRKILYAMHGLGLYSDKPYKKSARIVGDVMGKYHPHGDSAIYDAMVRMAQDFSFRYPLVEGQGNYGSIGGAQAAAMRYTEARMSKISMELLRDLNKNTVDYQDNYDGTETEPVILPSRFPNLLVNGGTGIAVGMATNIPPHNLEEIMDALLAIVKNPKITVEELMEYVKGPDFPTGGILMGLTAIREMYKTGQGSLVVRAKTHYEDLGRDRQQIVVTEIPYAVNKTLLVDRIVRLVKDKIVEDITDLRDESTRDGLRIVIELKRGANSGVVLNNLFKHTQLQSTFSTNMLVLDGGQPKTLNLKEILECYLAHQNEVIRRRTEFDLEKAEARAHILEGLIIALANIEEVVKVIKASKSGEIAINRLMEKFVLTEEQSKAILDMRLQRLTSLEVEKIKEELVELEKFIAECKEILQNPQKKKELIIKEITETKEKYKDPRRTEISLAEDLGLEDENLIPVEDVIITITERGYVKRMTSDTYQTQNKGGKGIIGTKMVESDAVTKVIYTSTHDDLFFFTNFGKVYTLKAYQIAEANRLARGTPIVNLLKLENNERLATVLSINTDAIKETDYLFFATKQGLVKKTQIEEYKNIRRNGIIAINLVEGDELLSVGITDGNKNIILGASNGKAIKFSEDDVRPMQRVAQGVRGILVEEGEEVVGMAIINSPNDEIVIVTENGYGKRTSVREFRTQVRGGKGVTALSINKRNGQMKAMKTVESEEDLIVITNYGFIIRVPLEQILTIGRITQGAKIITLNENQKVASIEILPKEESEADVDSDLDLFVEYE